MGSTKGTIRLGTTCSGSDVGVVAASAVLHALAEKLGLRVLHVFSVENNPAKVGFQQRCLKNPPQHIFDCVSMFAVEWAKDVEGVWVRVADLQVDIFMSGWSCKDHSTCNNKATQYA
eukprot:11127774-Karenia_brevis.AAC.1